MTPAKREVQSVDEGKQTVAERDNRRRRKPGAPGAPGTSGTPGKRRAGQATGGKRRQPKDANGAATPRAAAPARAHTLKLEVGGHGVELHCDTCELVVTHLAEPQVRRAVEEAHRQHLGALTWESGWVAACSCGWHTGRLSQQGAREALDEHEASMLLPAARGETPRRD